MIIVNWDSNVNHRFYNIKDSLKDNVKKTTYLSGRNTAYMNNNKFIPQFSASLALMDTEDNPEYTTFMNWYTDTLGGPVNCFIVDGLEGKWKFLENPTVERKAPHRIVTISLERVF